MERAIAVKKLAKLLGKKFAYEFKPNAPSAEERDEARVKHKAAAEVVAAADKQLNERRRAVLDADTEYQALVQKAKAARDVTAKLSGVMYSHRVVVGTISNLGAFNAFHVAAQGDSWEDVIKKVEAEKAKGRLLV